MIVKHEEEWIHPPTSRPKDLGILNNKCRYYIVELETEIEMHFIRRRSDEFIYDIQKKHINRLRFIIVSLYTLLIPVIPVVYLTIFQ